MARPERKKLKIRELGAKKLAPGQSKRVKGGYIGETEKLKGASPTIIRDGTSNT